MTGTQLEIISGGFYDRGAQVTVSVDGKRYKRKVCLDTKAQELYITIEGQRYIAMDFLRGRLPDPGENRNEYTVIREAVSDKDIQTDIMIIARYSTPELIRYSIIMGGREWGSFEDLQICRATYRILKRNVQELQEYFF